MNVELRMTRLTVILAPSIPSPLLRLCSPMWSRGNGREERSEEQAQTKINRLLSHPPSEPDSTYSTLLAQHLNGMLHRALVRLRVDGCGADVRMTCKLRDRHQIHPRMK